MWLDVGTYTCYPSIREAGSGKVSWIWGQPGVRGEILSQNKQANKQAMKITLVLWILIQT